MGVKGLWRVLQPVREQVPITSLRGKVLAVDLAIWVVQSETVTNNELQGIYLRQMFYKVKMSNSTLNSPFYSLVLNQSIADSKFLLILNAC